MAWVFWVLLLVGLVVKLVVLVVDDVLPEDEVWSPHATRTRAITINSPMKQGSKCCLLSVLSTKFFILMYSF